MIDLDHMPADWNFAQNHAKAIKPGLVQNMNIKQTKNTICICCLKPIIKKQVSLWSNSKQLQFLGFGFPLYYIFIKYCIILLLILICSYSSVSLYLATINNQSFCSHRLLTSTENSHCTSFMIRFSRIQKQLSNLQIILRISSFIIHLATLLYIRDHIQKTKQYYDQRTTSYSDYSIIFKKLPPRQHIKSDILKFINEHFMDKWSELSKIFLSNVFRDQNKVIQIILIPHIDQFYSLIQEKKQLIQYKRHLIIEKQKIKNKYLDMNKSQRQLKDDKNVKTIDLEIEEKRQEILQLCKKYKELDEKDALISQIAIVILNKQIFKDIILQGVQNGKINKDILQLYFGQCSINIEIQEAPEPNQIIWKNANYPWKKKFGRKILGWGLTFLFLIITTIGFYFLLLAKTNNLIHAIQEGSQNKYTFAIFLVFLSLFLIVFFNKLFMGWLLHYFTDMEKHTNAFEEEFSFGLKYTLGLFFTTALMTLAVQAITFHNFYSHEYGVIQEQSIMFIINAFFIPLIWLANPWQIFNLIRRKIKKNKSYLTQEQANLIMSDTQYTMGKRYAEIIQTMWFTYLYATLIPIGAFFTILGLGLYYWVDKFNLLRRSSLSNNISGKMSIIMLKLLDLTLLLKPAGQIIFDYQIRDGVDTVSIIFIIIGALYFVFPMDKIVLFFHYQHFNQEQKSFLQIKDTIVETYSTLHPIFGYDSSIQVIKTMKTLKNISIDVTQMARQIIVTEVDQLFDQKLKKKFKRSKGEIYF